MKKFVVGSVLMSTSGEVDRNLDSLSSCQAAVDHAQSGLVCVGRELISLSGKIDRNVDSPAACLGAVEASK